MYYFENMKKLIDFDVNKKEKEHKINYVLPQEKDYLKKKWT